MFRAHGTIRHRRAILALCVVAVVTVSWGVGADIRHSDGSARSAQTEDVVPPLPRPAYVYAGRCGELGEIQWPINLLVSPDGEARGSGAVDRTESSLTANVPLSIDQMLSGSYAIGVHESGERIESILACGNVGGVTDSVGSLILGLRQFQGSGVTGIAVLSPSPADAGLTYLSVFITGARLGDEVGTIHPTVVPAPADDGSGTDLPQATVPVDDVVVPDPTIPVDDGPVGDDDSGDDDGTGDDDGGSGDDGSGDDDDGDDDDDGADD